MAAAEKRVNLQAAAMQLLAAKPSENLFGGKEEGVHLKQMPLLPTLALATFLLLLAGLATLVCVMGCF